MQHDLRFRAALWIGLGLLLTTAPLAAAAGSTATITGAAASTPFGNGYHGPTIVTLTPGPGCVLVSQSFTWEQIANGPLDANPQSAQLPNLPDGAQRWRVTAADFDTYKMSMTFVLRCPRDTEVITVSWIQVN